LLRERRNNAQSLRKKSSQEFFKEENKGAPFSWREDFQVKIQEKGGLLVLGTTNGTHWAKP
jgi:hypothetical protein